MVKIVVGLMFGDEGKGRVTDALVRQHSAGLVVRFNGGAQAAHHVRTPDGREHCFSQFGSGTLAGADTFLSHYVTLDLPALAREADHLTSLGVPDVYDHLWIDPLCPVVTPYHRAMNILREVARIERGEPRHGSCGRGIGEVAHDLAAGFPVLRVQDLLPTNWAVHLLHEIRTRLRDEGLARGFDMFVNPLARDAWQVLAEPGTAWLVRAQAIAKLPVKADVPPDYHQDIVFEGAQGVLLDESWGFHPHTTWSTCTFKNALDLCAEWGLTGIEKIGVTRTFATRHGAGPFPSALSEVPPGWLVHEQNRHGLWQEDFRVGALDLPLLRYACAVAQPDVLAVTHLDRVTEDWPVVLDYGPNPLPVRPFAYQRTPLPVEQEILGHALRLVTLSEGLLSGPGPVVDLIERATGLPVKYRSSAPFEEPACAAQHG